MIVVDGIEERLRWPSLRRDELIDIREVPTPEARSAGPRADRGLGADVVVEVVGSPVWCRRVSPCWVAPGGTWRSGTSTRPNAGRFRSLVAGARQQEHPGRLLLPAETEARPRLHGSHQGVHPSSGSYLTPSRSSRSRGVREGLQGRGDTGRPADRVRHGHITRLERGRDDTRRDHRESRLRARHPPARGPGSVFDNNEKVNIGAGAGGAGCHRHRRRAHDADTFQIGWRAWRTSTERLRVEGCRCRWRATRRLPGGHATAGAAERPVSSLWGRGHQPRGREGLG